MDRPGPDDDDDDDDETTVTAAQVREVVGRPQRAGHLRDGDLDILLAFDAGYDVTRLAFLLADLPVQFSWWVGCARTPADPAPATHQDQRTPTPPSITPSENTPKRTPPQ